MTKTSLPRIMLIGRINAGKSTLFNALSETGHALTSPHPGTTRDTNEAVVRWRDRTFQLIDTGGLNPEQSGVIEQHIQDKIYQTLERADLLVFVIDGRHELTVDDRTLARYIKKRGKPCLLAINKIDSPQLRNRVSPDFYKLGLKQLYYISALRGNGTGDLLDALAARLPAINRSAPAYEVRLAIIGKTNVGKSSIVNRLLGEERIIVSPVPHTTRESHDIEIRFRGHTILLVDTAGLRKQRKIADLLEKKSVQRTRNAVKRSDITVIVTDVTETLSSQDQTIASFALAKKRGIILVANKWDLIAEKDTKSQAAIRKNYQHYFAGLTWAPLIFVSAKSGQRLSVILRQALAIQTARCRRLSDAELAPLLQITTPKKAKPRKGKKPTRLLRLTQTGTQPPTFSLLTSRPDRVPEAYCNLLEKQLRRQFDFVGTPIIINVKKNK